EQHCRYARGKAQHQLALHRVLPNENLLSLSWPSLEARFPGIATDSVDSRRIGHPDSTWVVEQAHSIGISVVGCSRLGAPVGQSAWLIESLLRRLGFVRILCRQGTVRKSREGRNKVMLTRVFSTIFGAGVGLAFATATATVGAFA